MNNQKTSIIIACYQAQKSVLDEVLAGIEEEGGIVDIIEEELKYGAKNLAEKAAKQSALGSGVGVSKEGVDIAFNTQIGLAKLEFDQMTPRQTGQNAARYTKNKPFI